MMQLLVLAWLVACQSETVETPFQPTHLDGYPNPMGPDDPRWKPQPERDNPQQVISDGHGAVWVTLQGSIDNPRHEAVRIDLATGAYQRLDLGIRGPMGFAMHPDGRWLVVFGRGSNAAAVIDTQQNKLAGHLPLDFYAQDGVFSPDGSELWIANRWKDAALVYDVTRSDGVLALASNPTVIPVPIEPRDIAMSADGKHVAVASLVGMQAALIDRVTRTEVHRLNVKAPSNDVVFVDDLLIVATMGQGTHHAADRGPDTDGDGLPGDGTVNTDFSDVQNEIAVFDVATGAQLQRFTSDTMCCFEGGDVDPVDPGGELLPPEADWIVGGALVEQLAVTEIDGESWVYATYSASNEFQRFRVQPEDGRLLADPVWTTSGHNPFGITVVDDQVLIAHRLGETVGFYDANTGVAGQQLPVGNLDAGPFPTTEAELGELMFFATPLYGEDDGDRSCAHCHRDMGMLDRPIDLTTAEHPGRGLRMNVQIRGEYDTLPWLWEGSGTYEQFRLEANAASGGQGGGDPLILARFMINEPYLLPNPNDPTSDAALRGKALFERPDVGCARCHPAPTFAASEGNNPHNVPLSMAPVVSPVRGSEGANFDLVNQVFLDAFPDTVQDVCLDVCSQEQCDTEPDACDLLRHINMGVPSLRGLWDHTPSMLHHGKAQGIREVLCTPGHAALHEGEEGFNEMDGIIDTHGGTSHLSPAEIDDLIVYLFTL